MRVVGGARDPYASGHEKIGELINNNVACIGLPANADCEVGNVFDSDNLTRQRHSLYHSFTVYLIAMIHTLPLFLIQQSVKAQFKAAVVYAQLKTDGGMSLSLSAHLTMSLCDCDCGHTTICDSAGVHISACQAETSTLP